jgi:hypothetical protein
MGLPKMRVLNVARAGQTQSEVPSPRCTNRACCQSHPRQQCPVIRETRVLSCFLGRIMSRGGLGSKFHTKKNPKNPRNSFNRPLFRQHRIAIMASPPLLMRYLVVCNFGCLNQSFDCLELLKVRSSV